MKSIIILLVVFLLAGCHEDPYKAGDYVYDRGTCKKYLVTDYTTAITGLVWVEDKSGNRDKLFETQVVGNPAQCAHWDSK